MAGPLLPQCLQWPGPPRMHLVPKAESGHVPRLLVSGRWQGTSVYLWEQAGLMAVGLQLNPGY